MLGKKFFSKIFFKIYQKFDNVSLTLATPLFQVATFLAQIVTIAS